MLRKIRRFPHLARKALREGLGWSEAPPSSWIKQAAHFPLSNAYRLGKRITYHPRLCTYITEGMLASGKTPLTAAFIGAWQVEGEPALDRFERYIFQPGSAVRREGEQPDSNIRRQAERLAGAVDLVLVAGNEGRLWQPTNGNWVMGPASLRRSFDWRYGETWEACLVRLDLQSSMAQVRNSGLRYSISRRYTDFSTFLADMYFPQVERQQDGYGERMAEQEARLAFEEHRTLLLVEDSRGGLIAGALMFLRHRMVQTCLRGEVYRDGKPLHPLARAAIDYFGLKWAFDSNCLRYASGLSLPFRDGVLDELDKSRLGNTILDPLHNEQMLLWAPEGKDAGLDWLLAHPLEPKFAQAGGKELSDLYQDLRERPSTPVLQLKAIPNTSSEAVQTPVTKQMEDFRFTVQNRTKPEDVRVIDHGLFEHALDAVGPEWGRRYQPFSVLVHNQAGKVVAGLIGRITWNYMHIDSLWVSEDLRGQHIGSRLMMIAERTARAEQAKVILLETTSFEARTFYPKLGFEQVAEFPDVPPGHTFYIMKKMLY